MSSKSLLKIANFDGLEINDLELNIALGRIDGVIRYPKNGRNTNITATVTPQDVWDRSHNKTELEAEATLYAVSTSVTDTMSIFVQGVRGDYTYQTTSVTLNGTTPVPLNGKWLRIFDITVQGATPKVGEVFISTSNSATPADATIQGYCAAICQKAQMSHFTVPVGYVALIKSNTVTSSKGRDVRSIPKARFFGGQYITLQEVSVYENAVQLDSHMFKLPEKTDLKFTALTENPGATTFVAYTIFMFPKEYDMPQTIKGVSV